MALKNEEQFQMYLDVLDIAQKNGFDAKTEKDGMSTKITAVYKNDTLCGKVMVVSAPPSNRESSVYALSAHAKLVTAKETTRSEADKDKLAGGGAYANFAEGTRTDENGALWYYGFSKTGESYHEWVEIVDKKFPAWREKSPVYLKAAEEMEKLKKKNPKTFEEFTNLEDNFARLAVEFTKISGYRDSPELAGECKKFVTDKKEKIYQKTSKALEKLKKKSRDVPPTADELAKKIAAYEEITEIFSSIKTFDDSAEKIAFCKSEISKFRTYHTVAAYKEAAADLKTLEERENAEKFFESVHRARRYKKLAKKFGAVIPFEDSKDLEKKCKKNHKHFRRKILKKIAPIIVVLIAVLVAAWFVSSLI